MSAASAAAVKDVIVIGAGPAGASVSIALARRGLSVTLVEREVQPRMRVGETLPPSARTSLEALQVWDRFQAGRHQPAAGNHSSWGAEGFSQVRFIDNVYGSGWHIDRRRFEQMLLDAAMRAGVEVRRPARLDSVTYDGSQWSIRTPGLVKGQFAVDATGRASALARICGMERMSIDQLIGAIVLFDARRVAAKMDRCTLVEAAENGWWYSALLPHQCMAVTFMTDGDIAAALGARTFDGWCAQLTRARATRERVAPCRPIGEPRLSSANTSRLRSVTGTAWLAVGDAAVAYDPLSSHGIVTALEHGLLAAPAIAKALHGNSDALNQYAEHVMATYRRHLAHRARDYGSERRWPSSPFWQRRHRRLVSDHETSLSRGEARSP